MSKNADKSTQKLNKPQKKHIGMLFVLAFAIVGTVLLLQSYAATPSTSTTPTPTNISLWINPASASFSRNNSFTFEVRANSLTTGVNAVDAEIKYDPAKLTVTNIDTSTSVYGVKLIEDNNNGLIRIARGATTPITGDNLVGKVTVKGLAKVRQTPLTFASQSALVNAASNTNALQGTYGANFTINR